MKNTQLHKHFAKDFIKLDSSIKKAYVERRALLLEDMHNLKLHVHKLTGEYAGYKSFNVTGDFRVIFEEIEDGYLFVRIGTHSELYG
jgi:addiction module RelE/StbE family toxin